MRTRISLFSMRSSYILVSYSENFEIQREEEVMRRKIVFALKIYEIFIASDCRGTLRATVGQFINCMDAHLSASFVQKTQDA